MPPHCHIRNEISKFSVPQYLKSVSYPPSLSLVCVIGMNARQHKCGSLQVACYRTEPRNEVVGGSCHWLPEIVSVETEKAACHCWRPDVIDWTVPPCFVQRLGRDGMFSKAPEKPKRAFQSTHVKPENIRVIINEILIYKIIVK